MKFKVGDKVKALRKPWTDCCGESTTIIGINGGGGIYTPCSEGGVTYGGKSAHCFFEHDIELVSTPQFKVGDIVRVIGHDGEIIHFHKIGDVGRIVSISKESCHIVVNGHAQFLSFEDFELIEPERKEVKKEEGFMTVELEGWYQNMIRPYSVELSYFADNAPTPKKFMATLKTIAQKLLDADVKAFVKAGWLDSELELTREGERAVLTFQLLKNKKELAAEARKAIKAKKKEEDDEE